MSGYIPSDHIAFEWENDTISCDVEPLLNADFNKLMPFFQEHDESGAMTLRFEDQTEFARIAADMLPRYVTNFAGLTDARGAAVSFDAVIERLYFAGLKAELITRLFALSTPSQDDEKKSDEPSAPGSPE